jgi:hypothetical protein
LTSLNLDINAASIFVTVVKKADQASESVTSSNMIGIVRALFGRPDVYGAAANPSVPPAMEHAGDIVVLLSAVLSVHKY